MSGWIKLHRELMDKPIWLNSTNNQRVLLITILMKANFDPAKWEYKGQLFDLKPGQFVTSLDKLKKEANMTTQAVRTALAKYTRYGFLTDESTKTGRVISIINWGAYQIIDQESNKDKNSVTTKIQQRCNSDATPNKNVKKDKNDNNNKEGKDIYTQAIRNIIDYLRLKTGQNFSYTSSHAVKEIPSRLKEGYKKQDFFIVIDKKCREWLGTEQQVYLRPSTLFRKCNFDQYLNALEPVKKQERKQSTDDYNMELLNNFAEELQCKNQSQIK